MSRYVRDHPSDLDVERQAQDVRDGHLADAEGVAVEAEGVFILLRWARDVVAAQGHQAPDRFE